MIQSYSDIYQQFLVDHDILSLMSGPYLGTEFSRKRRNLPKEFESYLQDMNRNAANYKVIKYELYFAKFCMYAVKNLIAEVRKNGV